MGARRRAKSPAHVGRQDTTAHCSGIRTVCRTARAPRERRCVIRSDDLVRRSGDAPDPHHAISAGDPCGREPHRLHPWLVSLVPNDRSWRGHRRPAPAAHHGIPGGPLGGEYARDPHHRPDRCHGAGCIGSASFRSTDAHRAAASAAGRPARGSHHHRRPGELQPALGDGAHVSS